MMFSSNVTLFQCLFFDSGKRLLINSVSHETITRISTHFSALSTSSTSYSSSSGVIIKNKKNKESSICRNSVPEVNRFISRSHWSKSILKEMKSPRSTPGSNGSTTGSSGGSLKNLPSFVKIVEVGPRDGLQSEKKLIPTQTKVDFINLLSKTGLKVIESTSFVHPTMVPQMGDNSTVYNEIQKDSDVNYPVLVPNTVGLKNALKVGVREIAVFSAASDGFSLRNVNCNISKSLEKIEEVVRQALAAQIKVRGYISCCLGCPYDGEIKPEKVAKIASRLYGMGCYEISLGDTIGVGTPESMRLLLEEVLKYVPKEAIAVHCHDTYGQALANILTALEFGICVVDSSVAGLGGCPFAEGATGNVATEDVLYMLNGMGIKTGVDMDKLLDAGNFICEALSRETASKAGRALLAKKRLEELKECQKGTEDTPRIHVMSTSSRTLRSLNKTGGRSGGGV